PQVIQTEPLLDDGTPFPTLWWLTCKKLAAAVGRLESGGWMAALNERLSREPDLRRALAGSTDTYTAARDRIRVINSTGHPGGGPGRVKCLHAHVAHHLAAGDNPAGRLALEELGWTDPPTPCV
ncbi:MAG: DUF501 domain-containing protein, partial [Actinomycetota bacterium]